MGRDFQRLGKRLYVRLVKDARDGFGDGEKVKEC